MTAPESAEPGPLLGVRLSLLVLPGACGSGWLRLREEGEIAWPQLSEGEEGGTGLSRRPGGWNSHTSKQQLPSGAREVMGLTHTCEQRSYCEPVPL